VVEPADGLVHRVEMLGTELFYATDQPARGDVFNYCAADGVGAGGPAAPDTTAQDRAQGRAQDIALVEPDPEILAAAAAVMRASEADVAAVEYLIDADSGMPRFFDLNPYSNFVIGRERELGFDPIERYLDHVLR
jgi:hypothetical protein